MDVSACVAWQACYLPAEGKRFGRDDQIGTGILYHTPHSEELANERCSKGSGGFVNSGPEEATKTGEWC